MKKSLLFILLVAFCATLAAQSSVVPRDKAVAKKAYRTAYGGPNEQNPNFVPSTRPSNFAPQNRNGSIDIGQTIYTTQSNANSRNTLNWSPDGTTCAATWTYGTKVGSTNVRGTGINYFDKAANSWDPMPTERLEKGTEVGSPGWGTHVFTEEGECVVAHSAAAGGTGAMVINYREKRGEGEWQQYFLPGPVLSSNKTDIYWPTVAAAGNTIHMMCVTSSDDGITHDGIWCRPVYFRSTDGGKSWDTYRVFDFDLMSERDQRNVRADDYLVTVRGNHVVYIYCGGDVAYLESFDGGDSWTYNLVYKTNWDWESDGLSGPCMYPTCAAAAIGDDDKVHIAFSTVMASRTEGTQPGYWGRWVEHAGILTWNEGDAPMKMEDFGIVTSENGETLESWSYDTLPNFMDAPDLLGMGEFGFLTGYSRDMLPDNVGNVGYISHPRLVAEKGKVYLMYSSIIEQPMVCPGAIETFFRGVFLTVSHDNGETYNQNENTSWLTYQSDLFWCDWSAFEHESDTSHNNMVALLVSSDCGYPTMAPTTVDNTLMFTWLNDMLPFSEEAWISQPYRVLSFQLPTSEAGIYRNTDKIWRGESVKEKEIIENLKVYPNPATYKAVINVGTENPYTLTVTNMMGQVVHTEKGQTGEVHLNVANYPAGIYIVNVRTAHASASQKLIVK